MEEETRDTGRIVATRAADTQRKQFADDETRDRWIHRSTSMRCEGCMWFVYKPGGPPTIRGSEVGRCRRHAPTMGGYPVVFSGDWCGDHKLDENKIRT